MLWQISKILLIFTCILRTPLKSVRARTGRSKKGHLRANVVLQKYSNEKFGFSFSFMESLFSGCMLHVSTAKCNCLFLNPLFILAPALIGIYFIRRRENCKASRSTLVQKSR